MIHWTIEAAVKSGLFDEILVSTDSESIAEVGRQSGASVPFLRNPNDADDMTPVWTATTNALIQYENHYGTTFDVVVQLMANCPLRDAQDIIEACCHFQEKRLSFLISVFKYGWMNPWWALILKADTGAPDFLFPHARKRSQDLPELYCPTGAIWIANAVDLKKQRTFYGEGWRTFELDWRHAVDIDDMDDYRMAVAMTQLEGDE